MGGFISNLVGQNFMTKAQQDFQDAQQEQLQAQTYDQVLQNPDTPPQLKAHAHQQLMDQFEEHGGREARDQLPQFDQKLRIMAALPVIQRKAQQQKLLAMLQQQTPEVNAQESVADRAAAGQTSALGELPPAVNPLAGAAAPPQLGDILPGLAAAPAPPAPPPAAGQAGAAPVTIDPATGMRLQPLPSGLVRRSAPENPNAPSAPEDTSALALPSRLAQFGGTLPTLAGTAPPPAATPTPQQQGQLRTLAALPPEHLSFRQKLANALVGFGGGVTGRYPPWYMAAQQRQADRLAMQDRIRQIQQAVQNNWLTPQQGQNAIAQTIMGPTTAPTRATMEERMLQDALQAEADRLGKPLSQLTAAESYKVEQEVAAKPAASGTSRLTAFHIPDNATGEWASMAGKTVRLEYDPKTHTAYNAAGQPVSLPKDADFADPAETKTPSDAYDLLQRAERDFKDPNSTPEKKEAARRFIEKQTGSDPAEPEYDPQTATATGDAALRGQPAEVVNLVKKIANYELQVPSFYALSRSPKWQKVLDLTVKYDPSFDQTQYGARVKLKNDFMSGKAAGNVRSINTLVGHLAALDRSGQALGNIASGKYGPATAGLNWLKNIYREGTQDPRLKTFNDDLDAVTSELAAVFKGTGASDQEIKAWRGKVDASSSPQELRAHIREAVELMQSRMDALKAQYETGMGRPFTMQFLTPENERRLERLTGQTGGGAGAQGPTTQRPAAAGGAAAAQIPPAVQTLLSDPNVKAGIHTLSDGSVWVKAADGTISRQQ